MPEGSLHHFTLFDIYLSLAARTPSFTSQIASRMEYLTPSDDIIVLVCRFNLTGKSYLTGRVLIIRFNTSC